jgi:GntR family transcriptional regulator
MEREICAWGTPAARRNPGVYTNRTIPDARRVHSDHVPPGLAVRAPLHVAIASRAEARISDGTWAPGSRLPPERELCRVLDVSRSTLRQALGDLERRGLITRRQGRGTFVARPRVEADATSYFTLGAALQASGGTLRTQVIALGGAEADESLAAELDVAPGAPVMRLERLRLLDGEPIVLETAHLPLEPFPGLLGHDFAGRSLYEVLARDYGRTVASASETLEPVLPNAREAALLGTARTVPALLVRRITRDTGGSVIEQASALLRGDRSRFLLTRRVAHAPEPGRWPPPAPVETRA